jgi:multidrug resistance protein MdtO
MALLGETARPPRSTLMSFLREELALRPGRAAAVARIAANCAVVVWIAMKYEIPIPLPGYMAYVVFLCSQEEAAGTLLTGVVAALAATIAVALSLLLYTLDASEPALRLPLMAGSAFVGIFFLRTIKLGPVAFLASFVLVLSQTLIDGIPSLEALTRFVLWVWVAVTVPIALTVLVNLLIGENPAGLARRTARRLLGDLAAALRSGDAAPLQRQQAEAIGLVELRHRAGMFGPNLRSRTAIDTMLIETLTELLALHRVLPADTPVEARLPLAEACEQCSAALERDDVQMTKQAGPTDAVLRILSPQARPVIVAMANALARLTDGLARRRASTDLPAAASAKSLFVPDAFSNPEHARFALKTTIAIMAAYIIYNGVDWPGIRTSVTTCFFVALGSLGETMHKLTLRIAGALIGGFVGALCIVYVLPQMEDIGQLCLLIFAVSAVSAWVATSSDRLSYAGMQMAFAFFLGVLHDYTPFADFPYASDLTGLRDRVAGILLGNLLMSLVFSVIWPVSAFDRARSSVAAALRALGQLLTDEARSQIGPRLAVARALVEARRFVAIAAFELGMVPARAWPERGDGLSLASLDRLAGATFAVVDQEKPAPDIENAVRSQDDAVSAWFVTCADRLSAGEAAVAPPAEFPGLALALEGLPDGAPASLRAAIEARVLLRSEIESAVAVRA